VPWEALVTAVLQVLAVVAAIIRSHIKMSTQVQLLTDRDATRAKDLDELTRRVARHERDPRHRAPWWQ